MHQIYVPVQIDTPDKPSVSLLSLILVVEVESTGLVAASSPCMGACIHELSGCSPLTWVVDRVDWAATGLPFGVFPALSVYAKAADVTMRGGTAFARQPLRSGHPAAA